MPRTMNPRYGLDDQTDGDAYVGTDPIYTGRANETDQPAPFDEDDLYDEGNHPEDADQTEDTPPLNRDGEPRTARAKASSAHHGRAVAPPVDDDVVADEDTDELSDEEKERDVNRSGERAQEKADEKDDEDDDKPAVRRRPAAAKKVTAPPTPVANRQNGDRE